MVHNLSNRELAAHQVNLLEKNADFNTINAKPIDFIGTPEPIVHQLNISDEIKNSIRCTAPKRIAKLRPKTKLTKYDIMTISQFCFNRVFKFNGKVNKQVKGNTIGSTICGLLPRLCCRNLKRRYPAVRLSSGQDTATIRIRLKTDMAWDQLNSLFPDNQFTR